MSGRTSQSSGKGPAVGIKGKNTKRKNIQRQNKSKNQNLPSDPCHARHRFHTEL